MIKSIAIYCGSSPGSKAIYTSSAQLVGRSIAENGYKLVYGGGNTGLMGVVANAAIEAGGEVIGVMPRLLIEKEIAHPNLTELHSVETMHERKQKMADLSDAFVALPGGIGTLEELAEVYTWLQLGIHTKPCALLNISDFYSPLIDFFKHATDEAFMKPAHLNTLIVEKDIEILIKRLNDYRADYIPKWNEAKNPKTLQS